MTTTATTWIYEIRDAEGDTVGQAPGTTPTEALRAFNRDAIENAAGQLHEDEIPTLTFEGETFTALPTGRPVDDESIDQRYTAERIASYTAEELHRHLEERTAQRSRAREDMKREHERLAEIDDPDNAEYRDALANLSTATREHATLNRIVRHLQTAFDAKTADAVAAQEATDTVAHIDLIDDAIARRGMPVSLDEAGDTALARMLWQRVVTAAETAFDERPTNAETAERVADLYEEIWMPAPVTLKLSESDARGVREYTRDAAKEAEREGNPGDWTVRLGRSIDAQLG
jgi:hypothetical protein